ncbi:MAG: molybdate ABC transporter substrate-binding protein [Rubrivivax sp.]
MLIRWLCRCFLWSLLIGAGASGAQPITVSAAASLQDAMREIGAMFVTANPAIELKFNFASSGELLTQIARGAAVDVFASADIETMNRALSRRLIDADTRAELAGNQLVLITPTSRETGMRTLRDLLNVDVRRIGVGRVADVPAGRYAKAGLDAQRLWAALTRQLVFMSDVREVLNAVGRGELDAGFVYRTDALLEPNKVRIDLVVPLAQPVLYPIARVANSGQTVAAAKFIDFARSPPAQAVLARFGFTSP